MLFTSLLPLTLAPVITWLICGTSVVLHALCVVVIISLIGCGKKKPKTDNVNNQQVGGTASVSPGNVNMSKTNSADHGPIGIKANAPLAVTNAPNSPTVDLTFDDNNQQRTQGVPVDPPTNTTDEKPATPAKTPPRTPPNVPDRMPMKSLAPTQASSAAPTEKKGILGGKVGRPKQEPSAGTKKELTVAATQPSDAP